MQDSMHINAKIVQEQAGHIHKNLLSTAISNTLISSLYAAVFWRPAVSGYLTLWLITMAAQIGHTFYVWWSLRSKEGYSQTDVQRVFRMSLYTGTLSSAIWAISPCFFFLSGSTNQQLALFIGVVLAGTMSVFSFGSYFPAFLAAFFPYAIAALLVMGTQATLMLTLLVGTIIFIPAMLLYAWHYTRTLRESLKLRFENAELIDQLIAQKEVAESATLAKSRFLAAASHDLRQPMHALNLYLSALSGTPIPTETQHLLSNAQYCAAAMDDMFRELLDISRLDARAVHAEIKEFAIATLLNQIRMEFEPQAQSKGLHFKVIDSPLIIRSDPLLLERILRNLVSNAVRYTTHGKILVGCRNTPDHLILSVYDTGAGIAEDQQRAIFEEFYQVTHPTRVLHQGLGLGLAIVDRFTHLLGARLSIHSQLGRGSRFSIELPRAILSPATPHADIPATSIDPTPAEGASLDGALVIVIDDEQIILHAMQALLAQWGCRVVIATSAAEAIARLSSYARIPSLIVCDYRLAGSETGIEVIHALHNEFNESIPALLITGDTAADQILTLRSSGFPVLHKPVLKKPLKDALLHLLQHQEPVAPLIHDHA